MNKQHIFVVPETEVVSRKDKVTKRNEQVEIPRKAVAPYNFIELPDSIVESDLSDREVAYDRYYSDLSTGHITCRLTTASPLYIRAALELEEYQLGEDGLESPDFYYTDSVTKQPVLPASSLRGLFRSLIEIISFSKISKVSDQQKFFFRAVAASEDDPLSNPYKQTLKRVKAGHLRKKDGQWFIEPAKSIGEETFIKIEDEKVTLSNFTNMSSESYKPQYISNISFRLSQKKRFADKISKDSTKYDYIGVLVTSGNMMETEKSGGKTNRRYHYLIGLPDKSAGTLKINEQSISHYRQSLTPFQKYGRNTKDEAQTSPFSEEDGFLKDRRCVFYCEPTKPEGEVILFGQSPNFRMPYLFNNDGAAASALDFVPDLLKNRETIDISEGIFGYVRDEKQTFQKKQSRTGKVSFTEGICQESDLSQLLMPEAVNKKEGLIPKILASPKPTTFQHYLVQTSTKKKELKHYASKPEKETVIRGHKMYWHQGKSPDIWHPDPKSATPTQTTHIRPIRPDIAFEFRIKFENFSSVELGSLLWILQIAQDDDYRLSIGMGKPLGMGAVKIESDVFLHNRCSHYRSLFDSSGNWYTGITTPLSNAEKENHILIFEQYVLKSLNEDDKTNISQLRRIEMLLAMLEWKEALTETEQNQRRYMEIERDVAKEHIGSVMESGDPTVNEYSERPILPTPIQIMGRETLSNCDASEISTVPTHIEESPNPELQQPKLQKPIKGKKVEKPWAAKTAELPKNDKQKERQQSIISIVNNRHLKEGDIVEVNVIKKSTKKKVTYELDSILFNEKESKNYDAIPDGEIVKVQVTSLEDGIIKHIKFVERT